MFQDDYFNFNITHATNIYDFLNFFKFRSDIIAYRPVSLEIYFFLMSHLFGFNALIYRLFNFAFLSLTYLLIFRVVKQISLNSKVALLTSSLWILASFHFMSLGQINYNLIGTFFFMLSASLFINFMNKDKWAYYWLALIFFLLTIGSFEFAVTWPVIIGYYYIFIGSNHRHGKIKPLIPYFAITVAYILLRQVYAAVPQALEYKIAFNLDSMKAFFWYILWTFNVPEEFKKQVVSRLLIFNQQFLWEYWQLIAVSFIGAIWLSFLAIVFPVFCIFKTKLKINIKIVLFCIIWFIAGISPVLILPNHSFMMYLTLPSIGIYFLMSYLIFASHNKWLILPVLIIWLITSKSTIDFYSINSYIVESQKESHKFFINIKKDFPVLPNNSIVLYQIDVLWKKQALMDQQAIKAIYNNPTISIYYNKEEMDEALKNMRENRPIFIYSQ